MPGVDRGRGGTAASRILWWGSLGVLALPIVWALWGTSAMSRETATVIPPPALDEPAAAGAAPETAVLAGGCFWGVQAVFQHVNGVRRVLSGYSGGTAPSARYDIVSAGRTDHAESVEIVFDPAIVSYGTILQIFFSVAHNPTELDRQGPDVGRQYRSAIFAKDERQQRVARSYIAQLDKAGVFRRPIVTRVDELTSFHPAEAYHQDYATLHPENPYIVYNDLPKVENLKRVFAALYRDAMPTRTGASR
jgi:peptide-methionine (S)-S-oxide reductase